jgi:hypothetical protein
MYPMTNPINKELIVFNAILSDKAFTMSLLRILIAIFIKVDMDKININRIICL